MPSYEIVAWNGQYWYRTDNNQNVGNGFGAIGAVINSWGQGGWELTAAFEFSTRPQMIFMYDKGQPIKYIAVAWNGQRWYRTDNNQDLGADMSALLTTWGQQGWKLAAAFEFSGEPAQLIFEHP